MCGDECASNAIIGANPWHKRSFRTLMVGVLPGRQFYDPDRKVPKEFNKGGDSQSLVHGLDDIDPGGVP